MAKKIGSLSLIKKPEDLITSRDKTRDGFISMALEKNYLALPYIEEAKALKSLANRVNSPLDLLTFKEIRVGLLTASGLSDKSLNYLSEDDKDTAIKGLIKEFLEPAGSNFVDELIYRYLLVKGDAMGGKARNLAGLLGERKFLRALLAVLNLAGIEYQWKDNDTNVWIKKPKDDAGIEKRIKALYWKRGDSDRILIMNIKVPIVDKNVDISILKYNPNDPTQGKNSVLKKIEKYLALGELKGGIDPAGADEHWKTAISALNRIRNSFKKLGNEPQTLFIGAAIENSMAAEIYKQIRSGVLTNAANLTIDEQLTEICRWITSL